MLNRFGNKLNRDPFTDYDVPKTAVNELANVPRYDITGERYGNTLSDDMFAIKNAGRIENRHTPESYDYFSKDEPATPLTMAPAAGWGDLPVLNNTANGNFRENAVGRKKFVSGDSLPWEVYKDWGLTDDILEFPEYYTDEQLAWAEALRNEQKKKAIENELSSAGMMNEKFGNAPDKMHPRTESMDDLYLDGALVNYDRLSPRTLEQLAKMGVNRPAANEDVNMVAPTEDASDYLNFLVNAYRQRLGL